MVVPEESTDRVWVDEEAGPIVRHYAMTLGRTRPSRGDFDLITLIVAARRSPPSEAGLGPEHGAILRMCQLPVSVAELAAHLNLPAGTIRVLLGDLLEHQLIRARPPAPTASLPTEHVLKAVLDGLRSL
jgi:hypothetical protein